MRSSDVLVLCAVLLGFAGLVTAQVAIAAGLARRRARWHALAALVVGPLAPYYALREKMWVRAFSWLVSLVVYAAAMAQARR